MRIKSFPNYFSDYFSLSPGVANVVEITGSLIPNFDVDVAVLRAGMDPEPTRGLMRSPTELMEGEPICSNACVCERQCV